MSSVKQVLLERFWKVARSKSFGQLPYGKLLEVVADQNLRVSEDKIFLAIIR